MIFQEFSLIPTLTVAQNIFLGREPRGSGGLIDDRASATGARAVRRDGRGDRPEREDARSWHRLLAADRDRQGLAQDARVLIMDEPTFR